MPDPPTQGRGDDLVERDGTNYFEKICLRGNIDQCRDKAWQVTIFSGYFSSNVSGLCLIHISARAFERVPGKRLEGFDNKIIEQVQIAPAQIPNDLNRYSCADIHEFMLDPKNVMNANIKLQLNDAI